MISLKEAREKVDELDSQLLKTLAERFDLMQEIAAYKKANNLPVEDKEREEKLITQKTDELKKLRYDDAEFVRELFAVIMKKAKELQKGEIQKN
ncbi:chorismate mutase [Candidatus Woesearchaeota archaeon]|nr:chorismate mutase [Candidatus Woesearchaeota archaeon]